MDFCNSFVQEKDKITWRRKQVLVGELFEKFGFDAPSRKLMELVWLDQGGIRNFENAELNKKKSLTQKIIDKLSKSDILIFKHQIVEHLKIGILSEEVLGNHLGVCRHLKIYETRTIILELINSKKAPALLRHDLLDIYLELGGELSNILLSFKKIKDFNSYYYFHYISKLIAQFPDQVRKSLLQCITSSNVNKENKSRAAQYLCSLGEITGFRYLVDELRRNLKAPYSIQSFSNLFKLDTSMALNEIRDLGYLLVDPAGTSFHFSESPRSILMEWLQIFALKSEKDLNEVINFYEEVYKEIKSKYTNAKHIFWYEEQVIEKFRGTNKTLFTFEQIKSILTQIEI